MTKKAIFETEGFRNIKECLVTKERARALHENFVIGHFSSA